MSCDKRVLQPYLNGIDIERVVISAGRCHAFHEIIQLLHENISDHLILHNTHYQWPIRSYELLLFSWGDLNLCLQIISETFMSWRKCDKLLTRDK
mgnify:CR=1 FL=1